jgi:ACS family glucarate transporter-like MFS transporter
MGAIISGASAGLLNLMGNLGGVLSIWLVPMMSDRWGWNAMILIWASVAAVAALLWLSVEATGAPTALLPQAAKLGHAP